MPKAGHAIRSAGGRAVDALPEGVGHRIRRALGRPGLCRISLAEFDDAFTGIGALFETAPDEARARLERTVVSLDAPPPADPFTDDYRAWTWEAYRRVSGRDRYDVGNETSPFDLEAATVRPFPYSTGSARTVGRDLVARGHLLGCIGEQGAGAGAHVVEFGPGWGNLTGDLTAVGMDVTAVEVDAGFCTLLETRHVGPGRLHVVRQDMLQFVPELPADFAVFFESFHHCADHLAMLRRLHQVVRPDGFVVFASEPVHDMPYPWGPRLDGLSVWSSRTYGWLELGFQPRYFDEALRRTGWHGTRRRLGATDGEVDVIVATAS